MKEEKVKLSVKVKIRIFLARMLMFVLVLAVGFGICSIFTKLTGPKDVELVSGWQLVEINGIVPKGTVLIVSTESATVLPNQNPETRQVTGYINQGRVNFYKEYWVITKTRVWAYYPPQDYEFLIKRNNFVAECQKKLSELTEGKDVLVDEYDVGHQ